ncbi:MAG: bifunctional riboflavin kinase/FAD synthetase [Chloroflexi bacterium]|nr:bifunctional riboflavin kinase/FAD synthetase [Chloroflexota bacterium]
MMQHYTALAPLHLRDTWVTIGVFDGVHLGHQALLRDFVAEARQHNAQAVVVTFYPHPAEVLGGLKAPLYLTSPEEKADLIAALGVDVLITHPFDREIAQRSAEEFMADLHTHLGLRRLWVGYDFALGRNREGDIPTLRRLGERFRYTLHVVEAYRLDGEIVSSTRIRQALAEGDVTRAERFLGRRYAVRGKVVQGDGRGRSLGFPTANLDIWPKRMLPAAGVYACYAQVEGQTYPAVVNIGVRPTFEDAPVPPRVEAHLLDFSGDLYGKELVLEFVVRLRAERRFPSPQALVDQIRRDIAAARAHLALRV